MVPRMVAVLKQSIYSIHICALELGLETSTTTVATNEPTTLSRITTQSTKSATSDVSLNTSMATSTTSSATTMTPGEVSNSDDNSGGTITIAIVVPVVLLIVLAVVVWRLWKRKKRNSQRNSSDERSSKKTGGSDNCPLGPFQFIPYKQKKPARKFSDFDNPTIVMKSCSLRKVLAKFPDNAAEMELEWLDESYVDLNVSNNDIYFKWKQSVPKLQGTIITFNLHCEVKISRIKTDHSYQTKCLRAKVLGTWSAGANPTSSTPVVTNATMTSPLNQTGTMTMSSTTSARSSSDSDFSGTIIATAVVVVAVLLIAVVGLVWLLCKRKKRNSPRNSSPGSSCKDDGTACLNVKKKEINVASPDSTYSKKEKNTREDIERIDVNGDLYALPDKNKSTKKINGLNYMDPSRFVSGSQDRNESQAQSAQPTEYAEVVGVMKPALKKTKKRKMNASIK